MVLSRVEQQLSSAVLLNQGKDTRPACFLKTMRTEKEISSQQRTATLSWAVLYPVAKFGASLLAPPDARESLPGHEPQHEPDHESASPSHWRELLRSTVGLPKPAFVIPALPLDA
jgi:hypothetical protein